MSSSGDRQKKLLKCHVYILNSCLWWSCLWFSRHVLFDYFSSMKADFFFPIWYLKCHEVKPLGVLLKLCVHRDCLPQSIQHWPLSSCCSSSLKGLWNFVCLCVLYRTLFCMELYFTYFLFFLFCCVCVSFKCQDKKCPREHASQLNKQNKISLKIVLIIFLAWISVEGATSLRLLTRKKSLKQKGVIFIFFSCFFTCNLIQQFHKFSPICMIWSSVAPIGAFGLILQHSLFSALKALVRGPAWSSLQNVNEMEKFGFKKKNQEQWLA